MFLHFILFLLIRLMWICVLLIDLFINLISLFSDELSNPTYKFLLSFDKTFWNINLLITFYSIPATGVYALSRFEIHDEDLYHGNHDAFIIWGLFQKPSLRNTGPFYEKIHDTLENHDKNYRYENQTQKLLVANYEIILWKVFES